MEKDQFDLDVEILERKKYQYALCLSERSINSLEQTRREQTSLVS
jgi:hypothetical protein